MNGGEGVGTRKDKRAQWKEQDEERQERGLTGECMQRSKQSRRRQSGQRWLPVCLWNTSQRALTVNAGTTTFPKLGSGAGGGGVEGEGVRVVLRWHSVGRDVAFHWGPSH